MAPSCQLTPASRTTLLRESRTRVSRGHVMPQDVPVNRDLLLWLGVIGGFIAAGVVSMVWGLDKAAGVVLVVVGAIAVLFAPRLTAAQYELAEKPLIPAHWKDVRPTTFVLWGIGAVIVGVVWLVI